jgi:hypothetical protein
MEHCFAAWPRKVATGCKSVTQVLLFCGREFQLPRARSHSVFPVPPKAEDFNAKPPSKAEGAKPLRLPFFLCSAISQRRHTLWSFLPRINTKKRKSHPQISRITQIGRIILLMILR